MLMVLSPAKTLDYETPVRTKIASSPQFNQQASQLIERLRKLSPAKLGSLMEISDQLAALNAERYAAWTEDFSAAQTKQAILAFNGDVYEGLNASSLTAKQLEFAQAHLRILSGLYGVLRPMDLMQAYRLEMGTRLANGRGKDLYAFWGETITEYLNEALADCKATALINLASEEYFKSVKPRMLTAPVITPVFEDWKNGRFKVISFYAKRARGLMARYAIIKRITRPEKLLSFDTDGYAFDSTVSNEHTWVFRRRLPESS